MTTQPFHAALGATITRAMKGGVAVWRMREYDGETQELLPAIFFILPSEKSYRNTYEDYLFSFFSNSLP